MAINTNMPSESMGLIAFSQQDSLPRPLPGRAVRTQDRNSRELSGQPKHQLMFPVWSPKLVVKNLDSRAKCLSSKQGPPLSTCHLGSFFWKLLFSAANCWKQLFLTQSLTVRFWGSKGCKGFRSPAGHSKSQGKVGNISPYLFSFPGAQID